MARVDSQLSYRPIFSPGQGALVSRRPESFIIILHSVGFVKDNL